MKKLMTLVAGLVLACACGCGSLGGYVRDVKPVAPGEILEFTTTDPVKPGVAMCVDFDPDTIEWKGEAAAKAKALPNGGTFWLLSGLAPCTNCAENAAVRRK